MGRLCTQWTSRRGRMVEHRGQPERKRPARPPTFRIVHCALCIPKFRSIHELYRIDHPYVT